MNPRCHVSHRESHHPSPFSSAGCSCQALHTQDVMEKLCKLVDALSCIADTPLMCLSKLLFPGHWWCSVEWGCIIYHPHKRGALLDSHPCSCLKRRHFCCISTSDVIYHYQPLRSGHVVVTWDSECYNFIAFFVSKHLCVYILFEQYETVLVITCNCVTCAFCSL